MIHVCKGIDIECQPQCLDNHIPLLPTCKGIDIECQTQCVYRAMSMRLDTKLNAFRLRRHVKSKQPAEVTIVLKRQTV